MLSLAAGRPQWVVGEDPLGDGPPFDEVLLHEAGNAVGGHAAVPGAFRVNDHRRPVAADAQAADLAAVAGARAGAQVLVLQLLLQRLPGGQARLGRAAARAGTQEDVPPVAADAELRGGGPEFVVRFAHRYLPSFSREPP